MYILSLIGGDFIKFLSCAQDKVLIILAIQVSLQVLDDIDTEELDISIKQRDIRLILCYIANAFL